ncbi:homeobox-leucine zipper protein HAT3-like [Cucurbita pepo subsp. pepo]|uniref:homeobox-leucine zipper protein HAT3-like n=1 Tax=Cucurbita pepo subsp. pepo TaxID=3664 RepID=UPI000C9D7622|nr:homeobox-leucine zipper protein HAT3-like [Cucurbita pepo subsp. pepo]
MGDQDDLCNIRLGLSLGSGFGEYVPKKMQKINSNHNNPKSFTDLSFTLVPKQELPINSSTTTNSLGSERERERKKLRLSKEQATLLEESFKLHTTLNPAQKQALAHQLNLKTRQVEVWFQNRRARTKLKQTEVDCEFLKKCCERLNEENRRLKKELHELRSIKLGASQLYIQLPKAATLTICPSCDKITRTPAANAAAEPNSPPL